MKDCKKIHPLLPFYIEEQLSSSEKNQVNKHLSACETARLELEYFRHLLVGLKNMPEPPVPADLHGKIMAKLGHNASPGPAHHGFWGTPMWALAAAAVVVVVLLNQFPDWRDTLRVQRPSGARDEVATAPAPAESSNQAPRTYAPEQMNNLAAKKKQAAAQGAGGPVQAQGLSDKKSLKVEKDMESALFAGEKVSATAPMAKRAKSRKMEAQPESGAVAGANLPAAAAPPAATPLPKNNQLDQSMKSLTYSKEQSVMTWNGNSGPSTVESQELVTDAETFQKYWQIPHPGQTPPVVDFTQNAVVVLMAGEKPTAGYSIHVSRLEEKDDQLVIHYRVDAPAPDAVVAQILTHPWVLQIIPKPSKLVVFVKDP